MAGQFDNVKVGPNMTRLLRTSHEVMIASLTEMVETDEISYQTTVSELLNVLNAKISVLNAELRKAT